MRRLNYLALYFILRCRIMSTEKEKSFWDLKATTSFIIACLEQVVKGEQLGTSFTKKGQIGIVSKFKELIGKFYDKSEFKNKFGNLRRKWLVWYRLLGKETGLRWDNVISDAPP